VFILFYLIGPLTSRFNIQAGDAIALEKSVGTQWMVGSLNGASGMFPVNFVDVKQPPKVHEDAAKVFLLNVIRNCIT
jgi:hypothetical protein